MDTQKFIIFYSSTRIKSSTIAQYCKYTHNIKRKAHLEKIQEVIGDKKLYLMNGCGIHSAGRLVYFLNITKEEDFLLILSGIKKPTKPY